MCFLSTFDEKSNSLYLQVTYLINYFFFSNQESLMIFSDDNSLLEQNAFSSLIIFSLFF